MIYLYLTLCIFLILTSIINTGNFFRSLSFLKKHSISPKKISQTSSLYILIPAYLEQDKIIDTIKYFYKITRGLPANIVVVTTNKETRKDGQPTTQELTLEYLQNSDFTNIKCIHYPKQEGYMAHQLNYAFKTLVGGDPSCITSHFAIYNADSHPHPETFKWFLSQEHTPDVVQQVAILYKNYNSYKKNITGYVLKTFATLQSRWSLTHELPRLIQNDCDGFFHDLKLAHCIGHGLFIKGSILKENNLFSEDTMTEDLFLGYLLRARGIKISPCPFMELAESPQTIISNIKQRAVWVWGPMLYPYYFFYLIKNFKFTNYLRAITLALQGMYSWLRWLLSGIISVFILVSIIILHTPDLTILGLVALFLYGPFQYFLTLIHYKYLIFISTNEKVEHAPLLDIILVTLLSYIAIILHSYAGFKGLAQLITIKVFKKKLFKYKTNENNV